MANEPFNKLTDAEAERLAILAEECAEVIQVVGKILRHGYESHHPNNRTVSNRMLLETEIGHIDAAVITLGGLSDVRAESIAESCVNKKKAIRSRKYTHHQ